ncbi:MAG: hypothetical protein M0Z59_08070 [Nitrospiraceae bacterium]|nr:hypothetical protein [Nitrospiraceae bacterium]
MNVALDKEEKEYLERALKMYLDDLKEVIFRTEGHEKKQPLRKEQEVLKHILDKVSITTG